MIAGGTQQQHHCRHVLELFYALVMVFVKVHPHIGVSVLMDGQVPIVP